MKDREGMGMTWEDMGPSSPFASSAGDGLGDEMGSLPIMYSLSIMAPGKKRYLH